jgi:hypothetical protein
MSFPHKRLSSDIRVRELQIFNYNFYKGTCGFKRMYHFSGKWGRQQGFEREI